MFNTNWRITWIGAHYTKSYKFNFSFILKYVYIHMHVCMLQLRSNVTQVHMCKHGQAQYWLDANMHIRYSTIMYDTHMYVWHISDSLKIQGLNIFWLTITFHMHDKTLWIGHPPHIFCLVPSGIASLKLMLGHTFL